MCPWVYSEPHQTSKMEHFAKTVNDWKALATFPKKLHPRYFTGLWIRLHVPKLEVCETQMIITSKGPPVESPMCSEA